MLQLNNKATQPMLTINSKNSSAARKIIANPFMGTVKVTFTSGPAQYRFTGVSRRAILAAAIIRPASVGQWINRHCFA